MGVYFLQFFSRMLISRYMGVKGCFSQPKIFKINFSFLGQKIAFKNINHTLEDFSNFNRPFKSTVPSNINLKNYMWLDGLALYWHFKNAIFVWKSYIIEKLNIKESRPFPLKWQNTGVRHFNFLKTMLESFDIYMSRLNLKCRPSVPR